jgi:hypothetical protein
LSWELLNGFVFWPFGLFVPSPRTPGPQIDVAAIKQRLAGAGIPPREMTRSLLRDSHVAVSWIASSMIARQAQPFPAALSKTMAAWLKGLDYEQLAMLISAGSTRLFDHMTGKKLLEGVPPLRELPAVIVRFPPLPAVGPDMPRTANAPQRS